jgi:hypothetical protein
MTARSKTALHIVLDTNALFTEAADRLLATEISEFVLKSFDNDLNVRWYIPSVVTGERRFQMVERANRLLPQLEKVERLLGHNLGITEEVLAARVDDVIKRHIETHKLNEVGFHESSVDWQEMVRRSISRMPPFDEGENEKGFRDAIVLETFCQLASDLPKSLQVCRIILLSNDERLVEAARERMADRNNVTFANDLDAVKTILNALASAITQEAVNKLLPRADELFFKSEEKKTLYYSAEIGAKIRSQHSQELSQVPPGFSSVKTKATYISSPPTFLVKEGQKLTFSTRITFRMEATRYVQRPPVINPVFSGLPGGGGISTGVLDSGALSRFMSTGISHPSTGISHPTSVAGVSNFVAGPTGISPPQYDEIKRDGEIIFEAIWEATLTSSGKLTRPKLIKIEHKATNWKET